MGASSDFRDMARRCGSGVIRLDLLDESELSNLQEFLRAKAGARGVFVYRSVGWHGVFELQLRQRQFGIAVPGSAGGDDAGGGEGEPIKMLVFPQFADGRVGAVSADEDIDSANSGEYAGRWKHGGVRRSGCGRRPGRFARAGMTRRNGTRSRRCSRRRPGSGRRSRFWIRRGICWRRARNFGAGAWTNGALIELTARDRRSVGNDAGDGGDQCAGGGGGGGADAWRSGEFSILPECVGADWRRIERDADGFDDGWELDADVSVEHDWQRIVLPASLGQATTSVTFGAQLAAGASVDLFGMQVEAQLAPSDYKMTGTYGGVYAKARFASDRITVTAQGRMFMTR